MIDSHHSAHTTVLANRWVESGLVSAMNKVTCGKLQKQASILLGSAGDQNRENSRWDSPVCWNIDMGTLCNQTHCCSISLPIAHCSSTTDCTCLRAQASTFTTPHSSILPRLQQRRLSQEATAQSQSWRIGRRQMTGVDYLLWGNHLFVVGSVGYLVADLAFSLSSTYEFAAAPTAYSFLALLFVIDSLLYLRCTIGCFSTGKEVVVVGKKVETEATAFPHRRALSAPVVSANGRSLQCVLPYFHSVLQEQRIHMRAAASVDYSGQTSSHHHRAHSEGVKVIAPSTVFCEHQTSTSVRSAESKSSIVLRADAMAELLNVVASVVNVVSSCIMFADRSTDGWIRGMVWCDLLSATIWLIDSLCYFRAWQVSLSDDILARKCWWRPASTWYWANVLNMGASIVYLLIAFVAWLKTIDNTDGDALEILMEQRAAFIIGDVLYLLCALACVRSWQLDRLTESAEVKAIQPPDTAFV